MPTNYPGQTDRETTVLAAMLEVGEASIKELSLHTRIEEDKLTTALERLIALQYVVQQEKDATVYRPVAHIPR